MTFEHWQTEVERLLYEQGHTAFNISQVKEAEEYWRMKYDEGLSPQEAISEANDDSF